MSQCRSPLYNTIGHTYNETRKEDPRLAREIRRALGDARTVVNVGAGSGAYEPRDIDVVAVEPSEAMIRQRSGGAAPAIRASAEILPFEDGCFDAALAVNTLHHWSDVRAGLREIRRVTRRRVVLFLWNPLAGTPFWLTREYLPMLDPSRRFAPIVSAIQEELPEVCQRFVSMPLDCQDGLFTAYWGRPEMYLDAKVRRNMWNFALADQREVERGLAALRSDLDTGVWDASHGWLRTTPELNLGHTIFIAEFVRGGVTSSPKRLSISPASPYP